MIASPMRRRWHRHQGVSEHMIAAIRAQAGHEVEHPDDQQRAQHAAHHERRGDPEHGRGRAGEGEGHGHEAEGDEPVQAAHAPAQPHRHPRLHERVPHDHAHRLAEPHRERDGDRLPRAVDHRVELPGGLVGGSVVEREEALGEVEAAVRETSGLDGVVAIGWPLSVYVAELNAQRFDSPEAQKLFNPLHGVSLMGSAITTVVAGVVLLLGAAMPNGGGAPKPQPPSTSP